MEANGWRTPTGHRWRTGEPEQASQSQRWYPPRFDLERWAEELQKKQLPDVARPMTAEELANWSPTQIEEKSRLERQRETVHPLLHSTFDRMVTSSSDWFPLAVLDHLTRWTRHLEQKSQPLELKDLFPI